MIDKIVRKNFCTETAKGIIVRNTDLGIDSPMAITVQYSVQGQDYTIQETVKLKSKPVRIWIIPIGHKKYPVIGSIAVGTVVNVKYNPDNPQEAYLPDNVGILNE